MSSLAQYPLATKRQQALTRFRDIPKVLPANNTLICIRVRSHTCIHKTRESTQSSGIEQTTKTTTTSQINPNQQFKSSTTTSRTVFFFHQKVRERGCCVGKFRRMTLVTLNKVMASRRHFTGN